MTVIAVREGVMVADSLVNGGDMVYGLVQKWREVADVHGGGYIAGAGDLGQVVRNIDRFARQGGDLDCEDASYIHLRADGTVAMCQAGGWFEYEANFFAIGSGEQVAMAAMMAGASAEDAVKIACKLMPGRCGGNLHVLRLDDDVAVIAA